MRQFVSKRFGIGLSEAPLGVCPEASQEASPEQTREASWRRLSDEAWRTGAKIFFADEAHFRADAELRGC